MANAGKTIGSSLLTDNRDSGEPTQFLPRHLHTFHAEKVITGDYYEYSRGSIGESLPANWNLPPVNKGFYERDLSKKLLQEMVSQQDKTQQQVVLVAMSGLGGVGKTELAKHYIHCPPAEKNYTARLWLQADTRERLEKDYRSLAQELNLPIDKDTTDDQIKKRLHTFLAAHPGWLMVVDNADEAEQIQPLLPAVGGDILITSRQPHWNGKIIKIDILSPSEAVAFYQQLSNRPEEEIGSIATLVEALGYLPLAIAQAAAYVESSPRVDAEAYLRLFNEARAELLKLNKLPAADETATTRLTIMTTWQLSLAAIEQKYSSTQAEREYARTVLTGCAFLDARNIPYDILEKYLVAVYPGQVNSLSLDTAIGDLRRYSLIQADKDFVHVHKLVQDAISGMIAEGKGVVFLEDLLKVVATASREQTPNMADINRRRKLLPHLVALANAIERMKDSLGQFESLKIIVLECAGHLNLLFGAVKVANEQFTNVLKMLEQHRRADSDTDIIAKTLVNLSITHSLLGDVREQKSLLKKAVPILENLYGPQDIQVTTALINLANAYGILGKYFKQKALLERVWSIQRSYYEDNHVEVAKTLVNLSNVYSDLGEANKQKELLEKALPILENHYGDNHVEILKALTNLANVLGELGDAWQQKKLLEKVLAIQKIFYGGSDVEVAKTLVNLSNAHGDLGNANKQKDLLKEALIIQKAFYGDSHVEVAKILANLSNAYSTLGKTSKQKKLLEKALPTLKKYYGDKHIEVAGILVNLANSELTLGDTTAAQELLKIASSIQKTFHKENHICMARILFSWGVFYEKIRDYFMAKSSFERALDSIGNIPGYGLQHPDAQAIKVKLAAIDILIRDIKIEAIVKKYNVANTAQSNLAQVLRRAVEKGVLLEDVEQLIERVTDLNAQDTNPQSLKAALHWAVAKDNLTCVKLLIEAGADWQIKDAQGLNSVQLAKQKGHEQILDYFRAPLVTKYKLKDSSQASLEQGLRRAAAKQGTESVTLNDVSLFIALVNDINAKDANPKVGKTALHHAIINNQVECVKLLLASGADTTIQDFEGLTVEDYIKNSDNEEIKLLFKKIAPITETYSKVEVSTVLPTPHYKLYRSKSDSYLLSKQMVIIDPLIEREKERLIRKNKEKQEQSYQKELLTDILELIKNEAGSKDINNLIRNFFVGELSKLTEGEISRLEDLLKNEESTYKFYKSIK